MGRRSSHTPEELRDLILTAATDIIEAHGFSGLSAREIAKRIGYSAGTLYNVFADIDDLVLTIESRLLDQLAARLGEMTPASDPTENLCRLAQTYLAFTQQNPKLWNLLFEHHMPSSWKVPVAFQARMEALLRVVENTLQPAVQLDDPQRLQRAARVLWASVHGITSLATADKLTLVSTDNASVLIDDLVRTTVAGLKTRTE